MLARTACSWGARRCCVATLSRATVTQRRSLACDAAAPPADKVAYQGVPGAFAESATLDFFERSGKPVEAQGCGTFVEVFDNVRDGTCVAGVLPIEDSIGGTFHAVYDLLLANELSVIGEHAAKMQHVLAALPGVDKSQIRNVSSHPVILNQCESYLQSLDLALEATGDRLHRTPSLNSATSCKALAVSRSPELDHRETAVICSPRAAELYGLDVLDTDVADSLVSTRYVIVGKSQADLQFGRRVKCSLVFSLPNEPMAFFKAISCFALRDIDIAKIESRPAPGLGLGNAGFRVNSAGKVSGRVGETWCKDTYQWDYVFYMDCELAARHGGLAAPAVMDSAIGQLKEIALQVRELGRYTANMPSDREQALRRSPTTTEQLRNLTNF